MRAAIAAFAAAIAVGGLLSGCADGQNRVGAAAIVGDTVIPIGSVQEWFDRVTADRDRKERARANEQLDDIGRRIVTEAVRHELLRQVAERERLRINEERVTELLDELGGPAKAVEALAATPGTEWLLYDETTIRDRVRDQLIELELGRKYYDETKIKVHAVQARERDHALDMARRIAADPAAVDDVLEGARSEGLSTLPGQDLWVSDSPEAAAQLPLFAVPSGTVMVLSCANTTCLSQADAWELFFIEEFDTDAGPSEGEQSLDADEVSSTTMAAIGGRMLATLMREIPVDLNPRYGVWDDVSLETAQNEGELKVTSFRVGEPSS